MSTTTARWLPLVETTARGRTPALDGHPDPVSHVNRVDASLLAGASAVVLTLTIPLWPENGVLGVVAMVPLGTGILLASAPYGGLHNGPPVGPLIILASIINGAIWIGVVRALCWLRDVVRILRS